jgi:DNA-binding transcriptional ArsR family regulator
MRVRLLHILCDGEKSVNEIVAAAESPQPTVSKHLNYLANAKVLGRRREGTQVFYQIANQTMVQLCRTVCVHIAAEMDEASSNKSQQENLLALMPADNESLYTKTHHV